MISRAGSIALAMLLTANVAAHAAESYCVSCSGPTASYVCEVTMPDGVVPTQSPQLYCAYRLAAEGKHASCSSRRSGDTPCPGDHRQLAYQGPSLVDPNTPLETIESPAELTPPPAAEQPATETDQGAIAPDPDTLPVQTEESEPGALAALTEQVRAAIGGEDGEPGSGGKTSERLTDDTVGETAGAPDVDEPSTGDRIASTAKTALNCLASWFKECE